MMGIAFDHMQLLHFYIENSSLYSDKQYLRDCTSRVSTVRLKSHQSFGEQTKQHLLRKSFYYLV